MMTELATKLGLSAQELSLSEDSIRQELSQGHPIICIMGPGDFTTSGHFIVLTGVDSDGKITVNDSNSKKNSNKAWKIDDLMEPRSGICGCISRSGILYEKSTILLDKMIRKASGKREIDSGSSDSDVEISGLFSEVRMPDKDIRALKISDGVRQRWHGSASEVMNMDVNLHRLPEEDKNEIEILGASCSSYGASGFEGK